MQPFAVSTSDPHATQAAVEVLAQGGSAIDAALCASMTLAVTLPMSNGIGGDAVFLVHDARTGVTSTISALGRAPSKVDGIRAQLEVADRRALRRGISTATAPALPWAWRSLAGLCTWDVAKLSDRAIKLATEGFVPDAKFGRWARAHLNVLEDGSEFKHGIRESIERGDTFVQPALGQFLEVFATSPTLWESYFISGLVRGGARSNGAFVEDDFWNTNAMVDKPIHIDTGEVRWLSSGRTTNGYLALLAARVLTDLTEGGLSPEDEVIYISRLFGLLYQDHREEFGEGAATDGWFSDKLSDSSVIDLRQRIDSLESMSTDPFDFDGDTTHFYVVDGVGNAVSAIQSLSLAFGCGVYNAELGLIFNSRLARGVRLSPNCANPLQSGCLPVNTIFPVMALEDGRVIAVGGTAGGDLQVQLNARAMATFSTFRTLKRWPGATGRWKYTPVSDVMDRDFGDPCVQFEDSPSGATKRALQLAGICIDRSPDIGGSLRYAVRGLGGVEFLDENRDDGLLVTNRPEELFV